MRNWDEVQTLLLERARDEAVLRPELDPLIGRLEGLAGLPAHQPAAPGPEGRGVMALHLAAGGRELRLFSMLACFGSALDATMESLRVEYFFPEDEATRLELQLIAAPQPAGTPGQTEYRSPGPL